MAFDAATGQVVLFGGETSSGFNNETWTFDGTNWTQQFPVNTPPSPRAFAAMAYDARFGNVVLFGGSVGGGNDIGDTWIWDGTNWWLQHPNTYPPPEDSAQMAYDASNSTIVLLDGISNQSGQPTAYPGHTWIWDGVSGNWTKASPANSPTPRFLGAMSYDPGSGNVVLFGGRSSSSVFAETWTWNGANWTNLSPSTSPEPRYGTAMDYDGASGNLVLYGGFNGSGYYNDTWAWNGSTWTSEGSGSIPPYLTSASLAADGNSGNLVLFGGMDNSTSLRQDTWTYQVPGNFGSVAVASSSVQTIEFQFATGGQIAAPAVLTFGTTGQDFQPEPNHKSTTLCTAQTYSTLATCTVDVQFKPRFSGVRKGAVMLYDQNGNAIATANLQGIGTGPQVAFPGNKAQTTRGKGFSTPVGVAVDGAGNIFASDYTNNKVYEITAASGYATVNTLGNGFGFSIPVALAVDGAGNVFVADYGNNAVEEILANGGYTTVRTIATGFNNPAGLALDRSGNLFVADTFNNVVKELLAYNGYSLVTTVATGFDHPYGVAVDTSGNLFVADSQNHEVKEFTASSNYATMNVLGSGFSDPYDLTVDAAGNVYVSDAANHNVQVILSAGGYTTMYTLGSGFNQPTGVAIGEPGNVFVADQYNLAPKVSEIYTGSVPVLAAFATTAAGQTAGLTQTVTVDNIGNAVLNGAPGYPTDFPEASGVSTDCNYSAPLEPGGSCTLSIDFSPQFASATGSSTALKESVVLYNNNLNNPYAMQSVSVSGTETTTRAALSSPAHGSVLAGPTVTFTWSAAAGATGYRLELGSTQGANDLYDSGQTTATSVTPANLPTNGTIVNARLYTITGSTNVYTDYWFVAASAAAITSPPGGGWVLNGPTIKFIWSAAANSTAYRLTVGTTSGATNLYDSGSTTATSATVSNLPTNGSTIYARMYTAYGSIQVYTDYPFTTSTAATFSSPSPGSVLSGTIVSFEWTFATGATDYRLTLGTTAGASNLYDSKATDFSIVSVFSLPTNGETIHARLYTIYGSNQVYNDFTFTAASAAALTSPSPGSVLPTPSATFTWSAATGTINGYSFRLGTTKGGNNLLDTGSTTATSVTYSSLPTNGEKIYARLTTTYFAGTTSVYTDYVYTATSPAVMTSPAPNSVLAGSKVTFNWGASPGATAYKLWIGTAAGKNNLYTSGTITTTSATAAGLPTNGEKIYVALVTDFGSIQGSRNYIYTAAAIPAALTSPAPNSVLAGPTVTFKWGTAPGSSAYQLSIGTSAGASDLYNSGSITATSATPTGLPTNGEKAYVTLVTFYGSIQVSKAYVYTAATQAAMISPVPSSELTGSTVTFSWSAAPGSTAYQLVIGSSRGGSDIYNSGSITTTSATAKNLPVVGQGVSGIFVRLITVYGSSQVYADYVYTPFNPD